MIFVGIVSVGLLLLGVPIAFALGLGGTLGVWLVGIPLRVIVTRFFSGVDSFIFLAVPFYILAAEIMNRSGITTRLIRIMSLVTGWLPGGTAYANIGTSVLFAGISGSAVADAGALGKFFLEVMPKEGYAKEYAGAVTIASAIIGPVIPPSGLAIIMAAVTGLSVVDLFLAGVIPGLMLGAACAAIVLIDSLRKGLPRSRVQIQRSEIPKLVLEGLLVGILPVVIVGGMVFGVFTATEGGGIAVAVATVIGVFILRTIDLRGLWGAFVSAGRVSASIYLLVAASSIVSYALDLLGISDVVTSLAPYFQSEPRLFLFAVMLLMLVLGMFLDIGAAIIIFVPLLMPVVTHLGIDPIQTAMVIILTLAVGLITPPVGVVLFVIMRLGNMGMRPLLKAVSPFLVAELVAIALLIFFPSLSTWLPAALR